MQGYFYFEIITLIKIINYWCRLLDEIQSPINLAIADIVMFYKFLVIVQSHCLHLQYREYR